MLRKSRILYWDSALIPSSTETLASTNTVGWIKSTIIKYWSSHISEIVHASSHRWIPELLRHPHFNPVPRGLHLFLILDPACSFAVDKVHRDSVSGAARGWTVWRGNSPHSPLWDGGSVDGNLVGDSGGVSAESAGWSWGCGVVETFLQRAGAMVLARKCMVRSGTTGEECKCWALTLALYNIITKQSLNHNCRSAVIYKLLYITIQLPLHLN